MKKSLLVLLALTSIQLHASGFPKNVEEVAGKLMEESVNKESSISLAHIEKVTYLDMDPGAQYYLEINWSYTDNTHQDYSCLSQVTVFKDPCGLAKISELSRSCTK